jgi:Ca2+-binding RTX toxin-like protein
MIQIYVTKDALLQTFTPALTYNYGQFSTSGYSYSSYKAEWAGSNLTYTPGLILPTGGTLTYVSATKLNGDNLYSASNFRLNLATVDRNWAIDSLVFETLPSIDTTTIIGSAAADLLPVFNGSVGVNGGAGEDTLFLARTSADYRLSNVNTSTSSATITSVNSGTSVSLISIEKLQFSDKTVSLASYGVQTISPTLPITTQVTTTSPTTNIATSNNSGTISNNVTNNITNNITNVVSTPTASTAANNSSTIASGTTTAGVKEYTTDVYGVPLGGGKRYVGTSNGDNINGTESGDFIEALGGNDTIRGLGGSDQIYAGDGDDDLNGGDGDDRLYGGKGNDKIYGGKGTDTAVYDNSYESYEVTALYQGKNGAFSGYTVRAKSGSEGTDTISTDVEYLLFTTGSATVALSEGKITNTTSVKATSLNPISGTGTSDRIEGTTKADQISAGAGDDTIKASGGDDVVDGGAGTDTLTYSAKYSDFKVSENQDGGIRLESSLGNQTVKGVERIKFSDTWFASDLNGSAGKAAGAIVAVFGASSLKSYMAPALTLVDSGLGLSELAKVVVNSKMIETQANDSAASGFVAVLFKNVVGRNPNPFESAIFEGMINSDPDGRVKLITLAAEHSMTADIVDSVKVGLLGIQYDPGF